MTATTAADQSYRADKDQALKSSYDEVITIRPNGIEDAKELLFKDNRARLQLQMSTHPRR